MPRVGSRSIVPSVDPSLTTRMSRSGATRRSSRTTRARLCSSLKAGTSASIRCGGGSPARRPRLSGVRPPRHAVGGRRRAAPQVANRPDDDRRRPCRVAQKVRRAERERRSIARSPPCGDAGDGALRQEQEEQADRGQRDDAPGRRPPVRRHPRQSGRRCRQTSAGRAPSSARRRHRLRQRGEDVAPGGPGDRSPRRTAAGRIRRHLHASGAGSAPRGRRRGDGRPSCSR